MSSEWNERYLRWSWWLCYLLVVAVPVRALIVNGSTFLPGALLTSVIFLFLGRLIRRGNLGAAAALVVMATLRLFAAYHGLLPIPVPVILGELVVFALGLRAAIALHRQETTSDPAVAVAPDPDEPAGTVGVSRDLLVGVIIVAICGFTFPWLFRVMARPDAMGTPSMLLIPLVQLVGIILGGLLIVAALAMRSGRAWGQTLRGGVYIVMLGVVLLFGDVLVVIGSILVTQLRG